MTEENISKTSRLKNIDETRNKFNDAINQKNVMSKKPKKNCVTLNFIEHLLVVASTVTECVSVFVLASLVGIFVVLQVLQ